MKDAIRQLDKRLNALRKLHGMPMPPKGWIRAIRNALGMTTAQLARRLGVSQPRIVEIEKAEVGGGITLNTLQRTAEALGCRLIYTLVPEKPLQDVVRLRASQLAQEKLTSVKQTMRLEDQSVQNKTASNELLRQFIDVLLEHPARLWDE